MGVAVKKAVEKSGVSPAEIVGIGVDTTCCSVVALDGHVSPQPRLNTKKYLVTRSTSIRARESFVIVSLLYTCSFCYVLLKICGHRD